jgi:ADP-ribosylglycohydrolase
VTALPADHAERMARAHRALDGLSVGDGFGERYFGVPALVAERIEARALASAPWRTTDDTEMGLSVCQVLDEHGRIDQDHLARLFAARYRRDPARGYGGTAHDILQRIGAGLPWRQVSAAVFDGQGSMGNGSAMRVAPVGAYFADDLRRVVTEAQASAQVTHFHPDGQAGAVAIAVAAAWAVGVGEGRPASKSLFELVLDLTPGGDTRTGLERAAKLSLQLAPATVAQELGSGQRVICSDTVPFSVWCAARHPHDYVEAMWATVAGLGDRDTTCAIVGGIVALSAGPGAIPKDWLLSRERLVLRAP